MAVRSAGSSPIVVPLTLFALLAAGVLLVVMKGQQQADEEQLAPAAAGGGTPFDDLPEEQRAKRGERQTPQRTSTRGYATVTEMPELDGNPLAVEAVWADAAAQAARADGLFDEAVAARTASEWSTFSQRGTEARALYEQALAATVDYVEHVSAEHGDTDPHVRNLERARAFWRERRDALRKLAR